ncbi:hypothetical protein [Actinoplanes solisilvae]|uniref:hypothetical protein n=1 Tax=Actinoplanes solisilvae TaxID=2486853 RepID=UPI000FDBE2A0|nr:hypothetical protein [Actinoplanes solisilvae]
MQHLTDGGLPAAPPQVNNTMPETGIRTRAADDPAVPLTRRRLADQLPRILATGTYRSAKDLLASAAVSYDIWRTLTKSGRYCAWSGGHAWNYDKVALIAEALGLHPPVVWLGYNLCEGPLHGRLREKWGHPGPWGNRIRETTLRACADLTLLGGVYAEQTSALEALTSGQVPVTPAACRCPFAAPAPAWSKRD